MIVLINKTNQIERYPMFCQRVAKYLHFFHVSDIKKVSYLYKNIGRNQFLRKFISANLKARQFEMQLGKSQKAPVKRVQTELEPVIASWPQTKLNLEMKFIVNNYSPKLRWLLANSARVSRR